MNREWKVGERNVINCSWCGLAVEAIWSRYVDIPGYFWDVGTCPCFDRAIASGGLGRKIKRDLEAHRRRPNE